MDRSNGDIIARHGELKQDRAREEPAWRDIGSILDPDGQELNSSERRDRDDLDVYDSTPLYALDDFTGGMFGEAMNPAERWAELSTGDPDLDKWGPVRKWNWDQMTQLYASMAPATSGFYREATPWLANMGRYGNGFLYQEEWPERQTIIDRSLPIGECFIGVDLGGGLSEFHREFKLTGRQMKQKFGPAASEARDEWPYTVIHAVCRNDNRKRGRLGPQGMAFVSTYVCQEMKGFRRGKGYYEMPYHPLFWNARSGRAWATGPGHNARADMNMNNEMERSNLVAAQFAAEPPILTHDDAVIAAEDIVPNAVLSGTMSTQGKRLLEYLQRGDNPQHAEQKTAQRREAIKEAFLYGSMMMLRNRPQMTATEFLGFKAEKLKLAAPYLVRIQQGLSTVIARRFAILARAGQTIPPPQELQGRALAVKFVSPLAKAQEAATGAGVLQWITQLGQIAQATGRVEILDSVNLDEAARVLHAASVKLPDVINDDKTIAAMRAARAQQIAQQQQIEQASQLAGIHADVAHANQAQSRTDERRGP